ncbi:IS3 family transposase [Bacillus cereus]
MDSLFSHFKSEMLYLNHFKTEADLIQAIEEYIYFYNYKRFQKKTKQPSRFDILSELDGCLVYICDRINFIHSFR